MRKNLEHLIFACIFYDYNLFLKIEANVFQSLKLYYEVLKELYNKHYDINCRFFKDVLKQRKIDCDKLDDILASMEYEYNNFDYYLGLYLDQLHRRNMDVLFNRFKKNDLTLDELKENILKKKEFIASNENEKTLFDIYATRDFGKPLPTVNLGRRFFNAELGFRNGELIIIAARTSIGKTSEMKMMALNCMNKNISAGIFSLEMTKERLSMDILATASGQAKRAYAAGKLDNSGDMRIAKTKDDYIQKAKHLIINDERGIDIHKICQRAMNMVRHKGIKVIFIDYLQIINVYHLDKKELRIKINYIADRLQVLAGELGVPIVVLAQLSRMADDRKAPLLRDLKESGKIEENADVVILINIEKFIDDKMRTECILRNNVAKNRNGATGVYYTHFDRVTGSIQDCIGEG